LTINSEPLLQITLGLYTKLRVTLTDKYSFNINSEFSDKNEAISFYFIHRTAICGMREITIEDGVADN
jgi:hypothetical protein